MNAPNGLDWDEGDVGVIGLVEVGELAVSFVVSENLVELRRMAVGGGGENAPEEGRENDCVVAL